MLRQLRSKAIRRSVINFRITDVQAAIGLAQLDRLEEILARRREVAERYQRALANNPMFIPPHVPKQLSPNWQSYQIALRVDASLARNAVMDRLHAMGVPTRRGVMASHLEPPYQSINADLPNTEMLAARTLAASDTSVARPGAAGSCACSTRRGCLREITDKPKM